MNFEGRKDSGDSLNGYCALEYRAHDEEFPDLDRVIAIVRRSQIGGASVRVHPDWRTIATHDDRTLIEELFRDFESRALSDSDGLLAQISMLSVGPLTTFETGRDLDESPGLRQLWDRFKGSET